MGKHLVSLFMHSCDYQSVRMDLQLSSTIGMHLHATTLRCGLAGELLVGLHRDKQLGFQNPQDPVPL